MEGWFLKFLNLNQESYAMCSFKFSHASIAALLALASATTAHAQKAGDTIVAIGAARISPSLSLGPLNSVGLDATAFNNSTAGATASAGYAETLSFSVLQMFTNNVAVEFSLGVPPTINLDVQLASVYLPRAAKADVLTPTAVAKYLFNSPADKWRPYAGLGLTYASFDKVSADKSTVLVNALGGTSASLSSSWAPVYSLGFIYNFTDRLSVNALVAYIPLKADVTFVGPGINGPVTTTGSLELNPTDYVIRLGYKF
jgi:outer membrane protein